MPTAGDCDVWDAEAKKLAAAAKAKRKAANEASVQAAAAETAAEKAEAAVKQAADAAAKKKAEKAAAMATVHHGIWCDQCGALPIMGTRFHAAARNRLRSLCDVLLGHGRQLHRALEVQPP